MSPGPHNQWSIARVGAHRVRRLIAAPIAHGQRILPAADTAQQAGQVCQMLGNDMDDVALLLQSTPVPSHLAERLH